MCCSFRQGAWLRHGLAGSCGREHIAQARSVEPPPVKPGIGAKAELQGAGQVEGAHARRTARISAGDDDPFRHSPPVRGGEGVLFESLVARQVVIFG